MALPRTLTGASLPNIYNARPMRASNGDHYVITYDTTNDIQVWKADNGDAAWAAQDDSNKPVLGSNTLNCVAAVLDGTTIHIATARDALSCDYLYHTFNTATDAWAITDENIESNVDTDINSVNEIAIDITVRSSGDVWVIYQGKSNKIMGTDYTNVSRNLRSSGTWGGAVGATDGGSNNYRFPRCVLGASDKIHFMYLDATSSNYDHRSLTSGGTLSGSDTLNDSTVHLSSAPYDLTYYDDAGDEIVYAAWRKSSNTDVYTSKITNDGTPAAEAQASDNSQNVSGHNNASITVDSATDTAYLAWIDLNDGDIYLSEDSGSGWGSHTEILDAVTGNDIGAKIYDVDNGDTVIGYIYDDGGTVKYNEYVVVAASGTVNLDADVLGTSALSADLDVVRQLDADVVGISALSAELDVIRQLDADVLGTSDLAADLTLGKQLDADVVGTSTLTADLSLNLPLVANVTGAASIAADLLLDIPLTTDITSASMLTADLTTAKLLASDVIGDATLAADLSLTRVLEADVIANSTIAADLSLTHNLAADIASTSVITADLSTAKQLTADVTGQSSSAADVSLSPNLVSGIAGAATIVAALDIAHALDANITGAAPITAALTVLSTYEADIVATAVIAADLSHSHALETDMIGDSSSAADVSLTVALASDILGEVALTSDLSVSGSLTADIVSTSAIAADLSLLLPLVSDISGESSSIADLSLTRLLQANITGASSISADIDVIKDLQASIAAEATLSADLTHTRGLFAAISGASSISADLSVTADVIPNRVYLITTAETIALYTAADEVISRYQATTHITQRHHAATDTAYLKNIATQSISVHHIDYEVIAIMPPTHFTDGYLSIRITFTEEDQTTVSDPNVLITFRIRQYEAEAATDYTYDPVGTQDAAFTKEGTGVYLVSVPLTVEGTHYWECEGQWDTPYTQIAVGELDVDTPKARSN